MHYLRRHPSRHVFINHRSIVSDHRHGNISFGIAFDIDGVLLRGDRALPQSKSVLRTLSSKQIPFCLLTNGGGVHERVKAQQVSKILDFPINESQVILSHTPLRTLVHEYKNRRVLILGCKDEVEVAKEYGFTKLVTPIELVKQNPDYYPWNRDFLLNDKSEDPFRNESIHAILIMHDPIDWHLELQVCLDVLRRRYPLPSAQSLPPPLVFNTNDDIEFSGSCPHPRIAQGSFLHTLELIDKICHNENAKSDGMKIGRFGKPHNVQFNFAQRALKNPKRVYMIGDNPAADIRGANNAGKHWTSILVLSGMTTKQQASEAIQDDKPDFVVQDVSEAIELIFDLEKKSSSL